MVALATNCYSFMVENSTIDVMDYSLDKYLYSTKMVLPMVHIMTNTYYTSKVDRSYSTKIALATSFDSNNPKNYFLDLNN